jgi:superkiller protein 3
MGIIYQKKGDRKKALKEFNKAIKLEPAAKFYNGLSSVYCDEGNFDRAVTCLNKALNIDPLYIISYINLSKVYLIKKNFNSAIKACEKALKISPGDSVIYNQIGRIYQTYGNFDKAIEFYLKVLEISPEMIQTHYSLGAIYEQKKLYSKAIYHCRIYLEYAEKDIKDTAVYNELKEKLEKLEKSPEFYLEQGAAYLSQGRDEDAEELWKKALEIDPSSVSASILLGGLYEKMGDFIKASAEYKRVLELRPDMEGIKKSLEEILKKSEG